MAEFVKRKSLRGAVGYARLFPDDQYCKMIIEEFVNESCSKGAEKVIKPASHLPSKWTEIYNRLFELINDRNNSTTYFSGPRFINLIKEFNSYFADCQNFTDERNAEGKSTGRKIFYYDLFIDLG
jgi:hypothetical protein